MGVSGRVVYRVDSYSSSEAKAHGCSRGMKPTTETQSTRVSHPEALFGTETGTQLCRGGSAAVVNG